MDTRQIILATRLTETLHFGKTAEIETIAQSGLSAQIAKLDMSLALSYSNALVIECLLQMLEKFLLKKPKFY